MIKDLHKHFNSDFRSKISFKTLIEEVDKFNSKTLAKLEQLGSDQEQSSLPAAKVDCIQSKTPNMENQKVMKQLEFSNTQIRGFSTSTFKMKGLDKYLALHRKCIRSEKPGETLNDHVDGIKNIVQGFKDELMIQMADHQEAVQELKYAVQLKVRFNDGSIRSCSAMDVISIKDVPYIERAYIET